MFFLFSFFSTKCSTKSGRISLFNRNTLLSKIFQTGSQCRFDGNCDITVENRRHCTACRIRKCFAIGMKKEWIRSEEEKQLKRIQSEKNHHFKPSTKRSNEISIPKQIKQVSQIFLLTPNDRIRLNNLTHCYDQYTSEPCINNYTPPTQRLFLRVDEFYNRKKPIVINFINYFKHLPEFEQLHVDDQVLLLKENIRILLPINYALLKTPVHSQFRYTAIQTIGCVNNIDLHSMYTSLSNSFVPFVISDPLMIKLLLIVLFFTTKNAQIITKETTNFKELDSIKRTQSSYTELLWLYMIERCGEVQARILFTKIMMKFLHIQLVTEQIDSIVRLNDDIEHIDGLLQSILQLT